MQEFEARTCPEQYLLDKVEGLHRQRDQLRRLVEIALEDGALSGGTWETKARAALKAAEEG